MCIQRTGYQEQAPGEELAAGTRARELHGAQTLLGKSPEFRLPLTHRCPTGHPLGKAFLYICLPSRALPGCLRSLCLLGWGGPGHPQEKQQMSQHHGNLPILRPPALLAQSQATSAQEPVYP